jgi:hypothetical protein
LGKEDYLINLGASIANDVPDRHKLHENKILEMLSRYNEGHCKVSNAQFICLLIHGVEVINNEEESHGNKSKFLF